MLPSRCVAFFLTAVMVTAITASNAAAQFGLGNCGIGCGHCKIGHCPPATHFDREGPPRIRYHRSCARPVCPPCSLQHYGYYQPCWRPWPFPPNWDHCPYVTPASTVYPHSGNAHGHYGGTAYQYQQPGQTLPPAQGQQLPSPRKLSAIEPPTF